MKKWRELSHWQRALIIDLALTQLGLLAAAWIDLKFRPDENVIGQKRTWRKALLFNFVGPLAYFRGGRRKSSWTAAAVPDMGDTVTIVTGANSGIGYETTKVLAQKGGTVVMACRNLEKAERAAEKIRQSGIRGELDIIHLDLSDLESVRTFADEFKEKYRRLDLLINNAGLMVVPFGTTAQGFESQIGVNHLGHFALTALLIERLTATPRSRIVNVSSIAHRFGEVDLTDLNWQKRPYSPFPAYGQSKLANLYFTYELQRRLAAAGHDTLALAAHPGFSATGSRAGERLSDRLFKQDQAAGALPTLFAATANDVQPGGFYGPDGLSQMWGNPQRVESTKVSHDFDIAESLWERSEALTGIPFELSVVPVG